MGQGVAVHPDDDRPAAGEDDVLRYIGAGDLESLIVWHGEELIDEIESKAPTNRSLRVALSNVWGAEARILLIL